MKATHRDYLHPGHLRVEVGGSFTAWSPETGFFQRTALCLAPSSADYRRLFDPRLPTWPGGEVVDGVERARPA